MSCNHFEDLSLVYQRQYQGQANNRHKHLISVCRVPRLQDQHQDTKKASTIPEITSQGWGSQHLQTRRYWRWAFRSVMAVSSVFGCNITRRSFALLFLLWAHAVVISFLFSSTALSSPSWKLLMLPELPLLDVSPLCRVQMLESPLSAGALLSEPLACLAACSLIILCKKNSSERGGKSEKRGVY